MITIATLRAAGLTEAQILQVVEIEQNETRASRRERNRINQQNHRARQHVIADRADTADRVYPPSLSTSLLPSVSKEAERLEIVALGREWAEFYAAYPHKVGKPKAKTSFERARKRAGFEAIMAGLARYVAKTDDRPWCNPATWLNQDRWADQPGPSQEGNGKPAVIQAAAEKRKREIMQRMQAEGASPYEIEAAIRRDTGLGQEGSGDVAEFRSPRGVVRSENQTVGGQLAFPKQHS